MAAQRDIPVGSTSIMVTVALRNSTTGQLLTGVVYGDVAYSYIKDGAATGATGTCVTSTKGTWADHGWVETDYAGLYQFGVPNACLATAVRGVKIKLVVTGAIDAVIDIQIVSPTRGLAGTALPEAEAGAVNGIPVLISTDGILTIRANLNCINDETIAGTSTQVIDGFLAFFNVATFIVPPSAAVIADAVFDEALGTHTGALATGLTTLVHLDTGLVVDGEVYQFTINALENAPSGSGASAAAIADAVCDELLSGHTVAGSAAAAWTAGGSLGTGNTAVDHNTGGTDVLRCVDAGGVGIDAVTVTAYLKTEYDAGNYTRRARTTTKTDGRWASPLMLDSGQTYVIEFLKDGAYGPDTTNVTVS